MADCSPESQNFPQAQHFFETLYPDVREGYLLLSWPSPTRRHKDGRQALDTSWHNLATTSLERIAARAKELSTDHSVYFGVAIQHPSRQPDFRTRSRNDSAYVLPGLYFDLDLASGAHAASTLPTTVGEALRFLAALPSRPSLILHTGGGLHAYWLFESPLWLQTEADRTAITHLLRQFASTLCQAGKEHGWTLDALRDLARILRPPGTINHKYGTPVEIIAERPVRYTLADFDWLTPLPGADVRPRNTQGAPDPQHRGTGTSDKPDLQVVLAAYGCTLTRKSDQEMHGAHPTHGSSTGVNLDVNPAEQVWHCWRHDTGGDVFSMIAVCNGLLACEQVSPGALEGDLFLQVLELTETRFGWTPTMQEASTLSASPWISTSWSPYPALPPALRSGLRPALRRAL